MSKKEMNFQDWMDKVDKEVINYCGLSVHDLPDCCFRDWFDDGASPKQAAKRAIKAANE